MIVDKYFDALVYLRRSVAQMRTQSPHEMLFLELLIAFKTPTVIGIPT